MYIYILYIYIHITVKKTITVINLEGFSNHTWLNLHFRIQSPYSNTTRDRKSVVPTAAKWQGAIVVAEAELVASSSRKLFLAGPGGFNMFLYT